MSIRQSRYRVLNDEGARIGRCGSDVMTPRLFVKRIALVLVAHALAGCGHGSSGGAPPAVDGSRPIDESRYVRIGGIDQWITIKGAHRSNPIILFVHGGPGNAMSPFADQVYGADWKERFTLVQWDQRGAGRTYGKSGPSIESTMTIERMVQDGIEVTQFVEQRLQRNKIILTGGSWGSMLGALMVEARPDLYCAWVATSQMVAIERNFAASYPRVLEAARAAGNTKAVDELTAVGPPPWTSLRHAGTLLRWARILEPKTAAAFDVETSPEYASKQEDADRAAADDFSFAHFFGMTLSGPIMDVDLLAVGAKLDVPVVIIHGENDLKATPELARAYFDGIEAPRKQFILAPDTGHEPSLTSMRLMRRVLDETVAPLCGR